MSEQAIETDEDEIIIDEGVEEAEETETVEETEEEEQPLAADEEAEIVLEGEEEPASKPRKSGYAKRIDRLRGRIDAAQTETEEVRKRELMLEEENKLLRMKLEQDSPKGPPKLNDFETDAEYKAAKSEYDTEQARQAAREEAATLFAQSQSQTTQATVNRSKEESMLAHYERVETLNIPEYEQLEDALIEVMGSELVTEIMANTENSHMVIPHLAKNLGKAERFAQMAKTQPVKCLLDIGALAGKLTVKRKHSPAPNPETTIDKGIAAVDTGYMEGVKIY